MEILDTLSLSGYAEENGYCVTSNSWWFVCFGIFNHASMCVTCAIACMEVRGLLGRVSCECLGSNSRSWACWQLFLPTEPAILQPHEIILKIVHCSKESDSLL